MPDLIPLHHNTIGSTATQTANAREIHAFLEVHTRYDMWIQRRIYTYGFVQDIDYIVLNSVQGPVRTIEYFVTLDMAKQLAMVEKTEKGREARLYFIEKEKIALSYQAPKVLPPPTTQERIAALQTCTQALEALGILDDRDRVDFGAYIRQIARAEMQSLTGATLPQLPEGPLIWSMSMRLTELGYPPFTGVEGNSAQIKLGTAIAKAYRTVYGEDPKTMWDHVKGQMRKVNAYPMERLDVVDKVIAAQLGAPRLRIVEGEGQV